MNKKYLWLYFIILHITTSSVCFSQDQVVRQKLLLNEGWRTAFNEADGVYEGFEKENFEDQHWQTVDVPHNWDAYHGYRRKMHGNLHGYGCYRKSFELPDVQKGKRYFLFFEGVGSYATVWVNGKEVGRHAGGRTTFTIDITDAIHHDNRTNLVAVKADHPAEIRDLPWVCGGCSTERGFSEGSQPLGIFRPVSLIITDEVRIEPFGIHVWNDSSISEKSAKLNLTTEVRNYGKRSRTITVINRLVDRKNSIVTEVKTKKKIRAGVTTLIPQQTAEIIAPHLWSPDNPYLYSIETEIVEKDKVVDKCTTPYGIRWISWPVHNTNASNQFLLNGKPVFINGVAEYEHLLGKSHAFSKEQVRSRALQIKAAGFNAFRDGHQPHNLRYQHYWDSLGILSWTQLSAHIWFDTPEFRKNYKARLEDWVKERRNSPSVVLWGIQNESQLPTDFAIECTELIRKLDPTASSQRLVTTCNGGSGTDWDVPQNWTGTYGGDPKTYGEDLKEQILVGEYGAWRTLDLHTEGAFDQNGINSEEKMTQLMETKVRLGESVRDQTSGHFFWLFTTHDNPGRVQAGEGYREMDRIGPANYKGLLTLWEEPLDVFYMFRSNYAPKDTEPMVYIASHTWPDRWLTPGSKDGITVYSNCDEVELFNDVGSLSLGKRKRKGIGTHFQWNDVDVRYNVLYAVGYVNGKPVAKDYIILNHLPKAPNFRKFYAGATEITAPQNEYNYLYRVNCGGPQHTDKTGNLWMADRQKTAGGNWGSSSWTAAFPKMPSYFASQRRTHDPISGTFDWELFQNFRYGREKLFYEFPVPDGEYLIELYFTEPWLGTGGGMDCTGWRLFDVAINGETVIEDLDIWKESGHDSALKKNVRATVKGGKLVISFPKVASGQALISAIAIATKDRGIKPAPASEAIIKNLKVTDEGMADHWTLHTWLDSGYPSYSNDSIKFSGLPPELYGKEWIGAPKVIQHQKGSLAEFTVTANADVYVAMDPSVEQLPEWLNTYTNTKTYLQTNENGGRRFTVYHRLFPEGSVVTLGKSGKKAEKSRMYIVAVGKANQMDPPYDLKPSTQYNAHEGMLIGSGLVEERMNDQKSVRFTRSEGDTLEWKMVVGVADIYAMEIRYHNPHEQTLKAKVEILSADGTMMKEDLIECYTTRPGKWNYYNTTTGSMINAGTYTVRLISKSAQDLSIRSLKVR